jgi:hypothetical protein
MDLNPIDLQDPSAYIINRGEHVINLGEHAVNSCEHTPDLGGQAINPGGRAIGLSARVFDLAGRGAVSRSKVGVSFLRAKIFTGVNAASRSGLMAAGGRRKGVIERTVPVCAYVRWTMFVKAFQNTIRVFSHRRSLGSSWGRGVLSRLGALRFARACVRVYVFGARDVGALRLFAGPVFAVRFTQPVGRGLGLVPAVAFARGPTKPKPATNAQNLAKLITGAGGLGKYAGVMRSKQLPLRLGTLQKACAAARGGGALRSLRDVGRRARVFSVASVGCGRRYRSNVRRSRRAAVGAARSVRDGGRRGGRFRKTTYSGLKDPQTS